MRLHPKASREAGEAGLGERAEIHAEDVAAPGALEMVVVLEAVRFVAGLSRGQDHGADALLFEQQLDRAVDRCDSNSPYFFRGTRKNTRGSQGAARGANDVEDHIALARISLSEAGPLRRKSLPAHTEDPLRGKRMHQQGGDDTQQHAQQNLQPGMAEQFCQLVLRESMRFHQLVDDLVDNARLLSGSSPHGLGVDHHDNRQAESHREGRTAEAANEADGCGYRAYRRRM